MVAWPVPGKRPDGNQYLLPSRHSAARPVPAVVGINKVGIPGFFTLSKPLYSIPFHGFVFKIAPALVMSRVLPPQFLLEYQSYLRNGSLPQFHLNNHNQALRFPLKPR